MRLLYFSPVQWHSYFQRPHYMIRYFLEQDTENTVLWINPYPTRFPNCRDIFRLRFCGEDGENKKNNRVKIISPNALPIEPLYYSAKINYFLFWEKYWEKIEEFCGVSNSVSNTDTIIGIGRPSKFALLALEKLKYQYSFYDAMDDFPEFYAGFSRRSMLTVEKKVSEKAEKIFVSSTQLFEKFSNSYSHKTIKVLNGYDMSSLPISIDSGLLRYVRNDGGKKVIIFGFVGTIGQWFDWSVVISLAKQFPEAIVRLVGPHYVKYSGVLPYNIEIFPECSQQEAINYVRKFDIGLIPFKQNALTQGVDPIKYYEYRAMGLPVLSTRFGEMLRRGYEDGVYFFDGSDIDKLFLYQVDIEKTTAFRKENDWKTRFSLCEFPL